MTRSSPRAPGSTPVPPGEPRANRGVHLLGKPELTTIDAVAQALAVGPLLSVGLVGSLIAGAGSAAPFTMLLGFGGALAYGWIISLYGRRYAGAGALYEYVMRAHGKRLGLFVSGLYFFPTPFIGCALFLATGGLIQGVSRRHLDVDPGWWCGTLATMAVAAFFAYRGIRLAVRTQLVFTALSAVPFIVFAVVVIVQGGDSGNTARVFMPGAPGQGGILTALVWAVLMFGGFEAAACLGEELRLPHAAIPRAIFWTIGLVGAFYLAVIYSATIGFGPANLTGTWAEHPTALWDLADRTVGSPTGALMELGVAIDAVVVMIAFVNLASRGFFALARDGLLPRAIAARSRHDTPIGGIVALLVPASLGFLIAVPVEDKFKVFEAIFKGGGMILPFIFIVLVLGGIRLLRSESGPLWRWLVLVPAFGVPAAAIYGAVVPVPTGHERVGVYLGLALYLAVAGWAAFLFRRRPENVEKAVRHVIEPTRSPNEAGRSLPWQPGPSPT